MSSPAGWCARATSVTMVCGSAATGKTGLSGPFVDGIRRGRVDGIDVIEVEIPYSNRLGFVRRAFAFLKFAFRSTRIALSEPCDLVLRDIDAVDGGDPRDRCRMAAPTALRIRSAGPVAGAAEGDGRHQEPDRSRRDERCSSGLRIEARRPASHCRRELRRASDDAADQSTPVHVIPNGCDNDLFGAATGAPWRPEQVASHGSAGDIPRGARDRERVRRGAGRRPRCC